MAIDSSLFIQPDFIPLRMALVDYLDGDYEAAIVLQRIFFRCQNPHGDGTWTVSIDDLGMECRLSTHKVKRAVKVLRARGYLASERTSKWDPTLTWTVVTSEPTSTSREGEIPPHVTAESTFTSCKEELLPTGVEEERAPKRRSRATPLSSSWRPSLEHRAKAATRGLDVDAVAEKFIAWAQAKDQRYVDWDKAFLVWLTRERPPARERPRSAAAQLRAEMATQPALLELTR
jgi:hypothetical protein